MCCFELEINSGSSYKFMEVRNLAFEDFPGLRTFNPAS